MRMAAQAPMVRPRQPMLYDAINDDALIKMR